MKNRSKQKQGAIYFWQNYIPLKFYPITFILLMVFTISGCVSSGGKPIRAFLPMVDTVPASKSSAIDGVWRISTIGKTIRVDRGRAYAVDSWMHMGMLQIMPGMVVIKDIRTDGNGGFSGYDLPLTGNWQATQAADGRLDVTVAGSLMPIRYRLLPVSGGYPDEDENDDDTPPAFDDPGDDEDSDYDTPPPGFPKPIDPIAKVGNSVAQIGMNCYKDYKPMGRAMLKYGACQTGQRNFNVLKKVVTARKLEDAKGIFAAAACKPELDNLIYALRNKGFKSFSLGISGDLAAIIGANGEAFVAINLDLSQPTFYGSVGAGIGTQAGASANGVVTAFYNAADKLSGKGKSFSVSLKALGGAGGAVGLSSGKSPRCESFSASAGAGAEANAGSVSATRTFKLPFIHKPDFSPGCKNVIVKAKNRTGREIKIVDVDFYDYVNNRWRSKIIKNTKIAKGRNWNKRLRLQKVGGDKTRVKVQYRVKEKGGLFKKWSKVRNSESKSKICKNGMRFYTTLR